MRLLKRAIVAVFTGLTAAAIAVSPAQAITPEQAAYINTVGPLAQAVHSEYDIPASVTVGQSILESNWGRSTLSRSDRNYFGFKCVSASNPGPIASGCRPYQTEECDSSGCHTVTAYFRVYASTLDSFRDYGRLLTTSQHYAHALPYRDNPNRFIQEVAVNYATDPNYAAKVITLMRNHDLYRFDSAPVTSSVGGSPAALYRDSVQFFAGAAGAGDGGALYQKAYVPVEGWRDWENLGGGITGRPSVVEHNGSLQAFARAPNGAVYQKAYVPGEGWRAWVSLGGNVAGDPVALSDGTALHVFARVANGAVYHKAYVPGEGWRDWENLGGEVTGRLAVVKYGNSVQVYARVANGAIYQKAYVPGEGWRAWTSLGGVLDSDPSIAVSGTALHIVARASNGAAYLMTYTPATGWRDWESLGGEVTGNPTAVQHGNSLQVYGRAPNGAVYQKAYVPGEGWDAWVSLGGNVAGDPVALSDGTAMHIFARVPNGALYHKAYVPGGWREWENLGGNIH